MDNPTVGHAEKGCCGGARVAFECIKPYEAVEVMNRCDCMQGDVISILKGSLLEIFVLFMLVEKQHFLFLYLLFPEFYL